MKTLTVRLPESLVADIEKESRDRRTSKSEVIRERLQSGRRSRRRPHAGVEAIADLIGAVDGLPSDLSANRKRYLQVTGYRRRRHR